MSTDKEISRVSPTMYRLLISVGVLGVLTAATSIVVLGEPARAELPVWMFSAVFLGGYIPVMTLLIRHRQRWVRRDDGTAWSWWKAGVFTLSLSLLAMVVGYMALVG